MNENDADGTDGSNSPVKSSNRSANAVDKAVGRRLRVRRLMLGLSISQLAELLCLNPQQVFKYETGVNRIGAARLHDIAQKLEIHMMWFFSKPSPGVAGSISADGSEVGSSSHDFERQYAVLTEEFSKISDPAARDKIIMFAKKVAIEASPEMARHRQRWSTN
jgi:transcriptional regulator with XRE-family HTH domain